jgi:hypothetical protein
VLIDCHQACESRIENVVATVVFFLKDTLAFAVYVVDYALPMVMVISDVQHNAQAW